MDPKHWAIGKFFKALNYPRQVWIDKYCCYLFFRTFGFQRASKNISINFLSILFNEIIQNFDSGGRY